jgi:hypothetical protein
MHSGRQPHARRPRHDGEPPASASATASSVAEDVALLGGTALDQGFDPIERNEPRLRLGAPATRPSAPLITSGQRAIGKDRFLHRDLRQYFVKTLGFMKLVVACQKGMKVKVICSHQF